MKKLIELMSEFGAEFFPKNKFPIGDNTEIAK